VTERKQFGKVGNIVMGSIVVAIVIPFVVALWRWLVF
jgi:hypothetical protein